MKKIFLSLAFIAVLASCKETTQEHLDKAKDALTEDVTATIDSAKIKAQKKLDSIKENAKSKIDSAKIKSAEKMEEAAKN